MDGKHEELDRAEARPGEAHPDDPASGRKPVYFRPRTRFGSRELRERAAHSVAWPLDSAEFEQFEIRRNLEQVGRILKRLELDQADIVQLRTETRAILAGLSA